jgi:hypothetical protein
VNTLPAISSASGKIGERSHITFLRHYRNNIYTWQHAFKFERCLSRFGWNQINVSSMHLLRNPFAAHPFLQMTILLFKATIILSFVILMVALPFTKIVYILNKRSSRQYNLTHMFNKLFWWRIIFLSQYSPVKSRQLALWLIMKAPPAFKILILHSILIK